MFCVIYELKVKPAHETDFRAAWHSVTKEVVQECSSLGARLHKSDEGTWIAYAQWPTRETWQIGHKIIDARAMQMHMDDWLEAIPTILVKLTVVDDLLELTPQSKPKQYAPNSPA